LEIRGGSIRGSRRLHLAGAWEEDHNRSAKTFGKRRRFMEKRTWAEMTVSEKWGVQEKGGRIIHESGKRDGTIW